MREPGIHEYQAGGLTGLRTIGGKTHVKWSEPVDRTQIVLPDGSVIDFASDQLAPLIAMLQTCPKGQKWSRITRNGMPVSNWTPVSKWDDTPRFGDPRDGWAMEHATLILRNQPTP